MSERLSRSVRIVNDLGLHLRAAGVLVQLASKFRSEIWLTRGRTEANAKSIMSVLSLAASKGVELELSATGPDAREAMEAVATLVESGFAHP